MMGTVLLGVGLLVLGLIAHAVLILEIFGKVGRFRFDADTQVRIDGWEAQIAYLFKMAGWAWFYWSPGAGLIVGPFLRGRGRAPRRVMALLLVLSMVGPLDTAIRLVVRFIWLMSNGFSLDQSKVIIYVLFPAAIGAVLAIQASLAWRLYRDPVEPRAPGFGDGARPPARGIFRGEP